MNEKLIKLLGLDAKASEAEIVEAVSKLVTQEKQRKKDEAEIAKKMERGLSREQAIHVIERQKHFDEKVKPDLEKADKAHRAPAK